MFIFGHVGITLGASVLISGAITKLRRPSDTRTRSTLEDKSFSDRIGLNSLTRFLDIRLLAISSLAPDIIDKPLAFFGFGGGRSIAHTLLVLLIFSIVGLYLYLNRRGAWLLAIAIGMFAHLVLDFIWAEPEILFWPLYGWEFPGPEYSLGFSQINIWLNSLFTNTGDLISESTGLVILLVIGWLLATQGELKSVLIKGLRSKSDRA